jgi:UDP-3-O-[3-hydroxymyristoyl] glucosamine N-acyltransferase
MCNYIAESASLGDGCSLGRQIVIEDNAVIGPRATLGHGVVIQAGARLGARVTLGNNVVVYGGTDIGDDVDIRDNAVIGRPPKSSAISTRKTSHTLPSLRIGNGVLVGANAVLYSGTTIGAGVLIADLASIRELCTVKDHAIVGRGVIVEYNTVIGERTKIQAGCHITGNMIIEDHVFLGPEVTTANDPSMDRVEMEYRGPHIKRGARIGANATLLPGVIVGADAVINAGALVGANIPDGKIAAAAPARLIGTVPDEERLDASG